MAKNNWWYNLLKNLFTCDSKAKAEKGKPKGWRWFFDKFRFRQLPNLTPQQKSLSEAKEKQRKHALNVAKATAAAAEAAMAAVQAATEVVRLTGVSRSIKWEKEFRNLAAIKIQAAFRAYLARKALRALKGVVQIQALARGRAVRRQLSNELNHSRSLHRSQVIHSHKIHRKNHSVGCESGEKYHSPRMSIDMVERSRLECKSQRQWTGNLFSKEEIKSMISKRHEAAFQRERMRQYSFSHRERQCHDQRLEETIPLWHKERHTCPRKKWVEENTSLDFHSSTRICDHGRKSRIKPRNLFKEDYFLEEVSSPSSYPRRSCCQMRVKPSVDDDCHQLTSSSIFPTYMAATESTKAKMRSMSTPRQRLRYIDNCFEHESPCKSFRLSPWSSTNGDSKTSNVFW